MQTREIVINACFGGFGLSDAAVHAYAARKSLTLYPEPGPINALTTYWTVPSDQRPTEPSPWHGAPLEDRKAYNEAYEASCLTPREIARDDVDLVAIVKELGGAADGHCAKLEVVEIPADVDWEISEYDGSEHVAEKHRTWPA